MSFETIKPESEVILDESQAHETVENKVSNDEKFTHEINGVMVTEEEYRNYMEQGRDAH